MLDTILTVATGGASGLLGSIVSKGFSIFDNIQKEKKEQRQHERAIEMHRLDAELKSQEQENELMIAEASAAAEMRRASYEHDASAGKPSKFVTNILRLVRPILTLSLIGLVGAIYFYATPTGKLEIESSVVFMLSGAIAWWFGDRGQSVKK